MVSFLLNPGKRRKARRVKGKARKGGRRRSHARRSHRKHRVHHRKHHARRARRSHRRARRSSRGRRRTKRSVTATVRLSNPGRKRRRKFSRKASSSGRKHSRRSRRRSNPLSGAMSMIAPANVSLLPSLSIPIPGPAIVGKLVNGTVQGLIYGTVAFGGYMGSGLVVDQAVKLLPTNVAMSRWTRPILFAAIGASMAGLVAKVIPVKNKAAWAVAISGGAFFRAACGLLANLIPASQNTALNTIRESAAQLADYIQTDGLYEAGMGETDGLYEAGMGDDMGDYIQTDGGESDNALDAPLDDYIQTDGVEGEEEAVVGF